MAALALLFSFITVLFSILAYCNVIGLKNSTHNIQYVPAEEFDKFGDDEDEEEQEDDEDEEMGMPISRKKKEDKREKELLEGFAEMYKDQEE